MQNKLHIDELGNIYSSYHAWELCVYDGRPNTGKVLSILEKVCQLCGETDDKKLIIWTNLRAICKPCKRKDMARMYGWKLT